MRILHTSDWHLGRTTGGRSRHADQCAVMERIVQAAAEHRPDVMLVCGDVYDVPQPPVYAQQLLWRTLADLRRVAPDMYIIVTAGNHDSGNRLALPNELLTFNKIYVIGTFEASMTDDALLNRHLVTVPGKGYVLALPYAGRTMLDAEIIDTLTDRVDEQNTARLPIVVTGHTTLIGADTFGHDAGDTGRVGGIDSTPPDSYATGYDYLALGHIHKPQWVPGTDRRARYCGSPMAHSFDETGAHGYSIVEITSRGSRPEVTHITIPETTPMVSIGFNHPMDMDMVTSAVRNGEWPEGALLRVKITTDNLLSEESQSLLDEAINIKRYCLCDFVVTLTTADGQERGGFMSIDELQAMDPVTLAGLYAEAKGLPLTDDEMSLLREIADEVTARRRDEETLI